MYFCTNAPKYETGDRYINYITDGATRMQQLISDLLTYSRLGKNELVKTSTDLNKILAQTQETLSYQIEQKQAVIVSENLPVLPVEATQIEQLFRNLIENGLKYNNSESPRIAIAAKKHPTEWKISIYDNLHIAKDGGEAISYPRKETDYKDATTPDLVLLDLNLPRKDGREVLEEIKNDPTLKRIPVIVLTTSDTEEDIVRSYNLGVNCYVQKPVGMTEFIRIVQVLEDFWFTIVKLPPRP